MNHSRATLYTLDTLTGSKLEPFYPFGPPKPVFEKFRSSFLGSFFCFQLIFSHWQPKNLDTPVNSSGWWLTVTSFKRPVSNVWPWKMCHVWGLDSIGKWVYATLNGLNYGSSVTEMFPNTDDFIRMSIKDFQWNNWQDTTIKMLYHFQDKWPVFRVMWWSHDDNMTWFESLDILIIINIHITTNENLEPR